MNRKKTLFSFLFLTMISLPAMSQQSTLSSNGNATGNGGTVCYSIGQVVYSHHTGISGVITEGVQQPYEIQILEGIDQDKGWMLECSLFPNPANLYVTLKMEKVEPRVLTYHLLDQEGHLLRNEKIEYPETIIPMDHLSSSTYFLTIIEHDKSVKTFKIIKK
jgi:hypothetical protein